MSLAVVGAGLGRTGTMSLKHALEKLLGGRCYHMLEVFQNPEHIPLWRGAAEGRTPDWHAMFSAYNAAVDWPVAAFWKEISTAFPEALIVLSRRDPESWWRSVSATIFPSMLRESGEWREMIDVLFARRFTSEITSEETCIEQYRRHVETVRREAPRDRLLEWHPSEGWEPLCTALGLPVPSEPFPHENTTEAFLARLSSGARATGA